MPSEKGADYHLPLNWGERLFAIGSNTQYLDVLGTKAGLPPFNFNAQGSNTLDSHRLLLYCELLDQNRSRNDCEAKDSEAHYETKHLKMRLALANRYFKLGQRLADHEVLLSAAEEIGLEREEVAKFLSSGDLTAEVLKKAKELTQMGIHSIPVFVFRSGDFETQVHGSSSFETFLQVFRACEDFWKTVDSDSTSDENAK
mmetsp:Transcript_38230/g.75262  ORF Transcript_38230/g.75262 Transcript_38230/m.75262 type:complete len:200 (+) Transcript_38230:270-869(+)